MSRLNDEGGRNGENPERELDEFLAELEAVMKRFPNVDRELEVLVGLRKTPSKAKSVAAAGPSAGWAQAFAAKAQCDPPCVPPKRCFIVGGHTFRCK
jgi:hypothetical protein